jgi:SAM-dependent methyltransferase
MDDAARFREDARAKWEASARGWAARRAAFQAGAQPVTAWLVGAIHPQPGHVVLELAAGPGDTGMQVAELVHPGGKVLVTDGAQAMVDAAAQRANELGLANVEASAMEAEWIDLPAAAVDGVLVRWGLMLLADPGACVRECRRVLRPGGRLAVACWDVPEANPLMTGAGRAAAELGLVTPSAAGDPGPFRLSDPAELEQLLYEGGFVEVGVEQVDVVWSFGSLDEAWEHQRDLSPTLTSLLPTLSPADHYRLRERFDEGLAPHVARDGSVAVPGRTHVAAAAA